MLGKLTLEAIPYHEPIIMGAVGFMVLGGIALFAAITYFGLWRYLWDEWLTSVDHKRIGIMYVVLAMVMLLRGFSDAIMMRTQQAMASTGGAGYLPPEHFDQVFTAHGVIMIFFMAMPFIIGLMNFAVPLQIGARDVAFPYLNNRELLADRGRRDPDQRLARRRRVRAHRLARLPAALRARLQPRRRRRLLPLGLQISGLGTLLAGVNFITTILKMRAPGMTLMKMPIFTWTTLCANMLIVAAFPILTATLGMLTLDRYLGMHFFTNSAGGNPMMYVNLIWAWGHPEVYILILPCFGIFSEVIATFSGKRLFGYTSMVYATVCITVLSFMVWLHHFFTMGSGADVNAFFGITTMIISIPTGVKIFNWLFTMYRGRVRFTTPVLWTLGFIVTFTIGGMTGVLMAVPAADFVLHNSLFLIAHFHNAIIGGVVFGCMAGFSYWFPKALGFRLDERLGKISFWCWLVGFYVAFMPLYALGLMGMTRRLDHVDNPVWHVYLVVAMIGAGIIMCGIVAQLAQIVVSIRNRHALADATGDPWNGRTLEWAVASPPPFYNFAATPSVDDRDQFWEMKELGIAQRPQPHYRRIHMPSNTGTGVIVSALAGVLGFALVWHIWWLAAFAFLGALARAISHSFDENRDYYVPSSQVARTEGKYFQQLPQQA